jgi:DNA primase
MDAKDEIKRRLALEDVVGEYIELKRSGRNWKAISPFTAEKTASFMVSPEKQIWHDFSSNKGGDMFTFVMEVEGVDFVESLEILARKALVDLSEYRKGDGTAAKLKKRLLEAHKHASDFYHLALSKHPQALSYIKDRRSLSAETIRIWKLGYSPESGKELYQYLKKKGFSDGELTKAGLITRRAGGLSDMFRGRIMVPLSDGQGNIVGFTARLLKDDKNAPKYFNTPQTPIYDKGRQVFGLHHAKEAIRKQDVSVMVEGNFDVISSHQAGVSNVIACAGTAMTADHLRSLSRLSVNVRLAFDADEAGLKATERAIDIAQDVGVELKVVTLPGDFKDPDEIIVKDPKLWEQSVEKADDATSWIIKRYEKMFDKTTAEGKRQLSSRALAIIARLQDPVEREHHIKAVSKELDVSEASLEAKLQQSKKKLVRRKEMKVERASVDSTSYEDDLLALNASFTDVRDSLKIVEKSVLHSEQREAVKKVLNNLKAHEKLTSKAANTLNLNENYVKILELLVEEKYVSWTPADIMAEAMALARRVSKEHLTEAKNKLTEAIARAEADGDQKQASELLKKYQQLLKEF